MFFGPDFMRDKTFFSRRYLICFSKRTDFRNHISNEFILIFWNKASKRLKNYDPSKHLGRKKIFGSLKKFWSKKLSHLGKLELLLIPIRCLKFVYAFFVNNNYKLLNLFYEKKRKICFFFWNFKKNSKNFLHTQLIYPLFIRCEINLLKICEIN